MADLTAECLTDTKGDIPSLRGLFCRTCANVGCAWSRALGGETLWSSRMSKQEERLFNPPRDEVAAIRDQDFRDAGPASMRLTVPTGWENPRIEGKDVIVSSGARIRIPTRHVDGSVPAANPPKKEG